MSEGLPEAFLALQQALGKLPGVGPKSAQRMAFHILSKPLAELENLSQTLLTARRSLAYCEQCYFLTWEDSRCHICRNPRRDATQLMIVAESKDVLAFEKSGNYQGLYHVLGGVLSPLQNIGVEQLRLAELFQRLSQAGIKELIFALPLSVEAQATRTFILKNIDHQALRVTQLATGLPVGSDLEYIDRLTLQQALLQRVSVS